MAKQQFYFVEVTDTYGGEANYSWVTRYRVQASSKLGAIGKVSRDSGYSFRKEWDSGDTAAYRAKSACVIAFVSFMEDENTHYRLKEI